MDAGLWSKAGIVFRKTNARAQMVDRVPATVRSRIMASVRSKHTAPELLVRRMLHGMGYRYRLHRKDLPGSPDLVFPKRRKVIFVNGCFWHGHDCKWGRLPKSNSNFWSAKIRANQARDARNIDLLEKQGWHSMKIWQCQLRSPAFLLEKVRSFLGEASSGCS